MRYLSILAILFLTQACGFEIVDTGHRGVEVRLGEVVGEPLPEGMHFYNPLTANIHEMSVMTTTWNQEATAYTKDVQQAKITFSVNYNLNPASVLNIYKTVGSNWDEKLVKQAVPSIMKNVVGKWEAVELVSNRGKATAEIEKNLIESLGAQGITISRFEITNIDYDAAFEKAVEAKVVAIQYAQAAENKTKQVAEEARQQIISAKAVAEGMRIQSEALAQNKSLVEYEAVKKWSGKLPEIVVLGGNGAVPFLDLGAAMAKKNAENAKQ